MPAARAVPFVVAAGLALVACGGAPQPAPEKFAGLPSKAARGVRLVRGAQEVVGRAAFCTRPATVVMADVERATPEGRELASDRVRPNSARAGLLRSRMHLRVQRVCEQVARAAGCDLIVRAGAIADTRGLKVQDLTAAVVAAMRSER